MSQSIKKKLMALMVVGVMAIPMVSFAQEKPMPISEDHAVTISEKEKIQNKYIKYAGEIIEVIDNEGNISINVNSGDDEYGMVFHISNDVSLWNRDTEKLIKANDLKEGMAVEVFYNQNTPMTMSLPPQLTPDVIVIQGKEAKGSTFVGQFDEGLVSADHFLQLNIGEDTVITNQKGDKLGQKDIVGKTVLVFYGMATKSIPAQTTPSKIIVLAENEEEVIEEPVAQVKEMIALRGVATELGYKVKWNNKEKTVELTKQNQTIVIKLDSVDYTLNKSIGKFSKAPELRNGTLYVSASILEIIK